MRNLYFLFVAFLLLPSWSMAFLVNNSNHMPHLLLSKKKRFSSSLHGVNNSNNKDEQQQQQVKVGSKEYLEGFISSPIIQDSSSAVRQESSSRGSGLEQGLKLAGSVTVALVVLFLGFMASNGLI